MIIVCLNESQKIVFDCSIEKLIKFLKPFPICSNSYKYIAIILNLNEYNNRNKHYQFLIIVKEERYTSKFQLFIFI